MRTSSKWLVLGGIAAMSTALVHCVGDDPTAPGGGDAGDDGATPIDSSTPTDSSSPTDAGVDANICSGATGVTCGTGVDPCIVQISGGGQNFCARDNKCNVYCWGDNRDGQLAQPLTTPFSAKPLAVSFGGRLAAGVDIAGPDTLAATAYTVACARVTASPGTPTSVVCWGGDEYGQIAVEPDASTVMLNDAGRHYIPTPTDIPTISAATLLGVGETAECAITSGNALECWGANGNGLLARDTGGVTVVTTPGAATFASGAGTPDAVTIGYRHMCTTNSGAGDRVACVGDDSMDQLGHDAGPLGPDETTLTEISPMTFADIIAASKWSTCAVNKSAAIVCWGDNASGQTGIGSASPALVGYATPAVAPLAGGFPAVGLTAGSFHFCAILKVPDPTDGGVAQNVYCWGDNTFGEAVPGAASPVLIAAPVSGLPARAAEVAAGAQGTCALINDGTVYCWGENFVGELGNGDPGDGGISGPVKVTF